MDDFSQAQLEALFPGRSVRWLAETGSTNDEGLDWLAQGGPQGALVVADVQTHGRGRLGRAWFAPPGSALLFTYGFRAPHALAARATMLGGLAVAETLREQGVADVGIKYPNDVQIARRKVCGVLAEATWGGQVAIALGIGLNVRVDFAGTPFAESAVSLHSLPGASSGRAGWLAAIVARLDFWRARLGTDALPSAWRACLNMLGEWVEVETGEMRLAGIAEDVTGRGALVLRDPLGTRREVWAGDVLAPGSERPLGPKGDA
jgi:BirA family biotin operon repressor/biotin-[acetyl-CoA-carboxylase] ligase